MESIGIYTNLCDNTIITCLQSILESFSSTNYTFYLVADIHCQIPSELNLSQSIASFERVEDLPNPSFIISLGGDGTFLKASHFVAKSGIPIIGINLGRMGFLTDISKDDLAGFAKKIQAKQYYIEERPYIELSSKPELFRNENYALNEITIHKKESSHLMTIHIWVDEEYLGSFWVDGLMVSSPTGSTAYSLSLGGPIVTPNSPNFIINTIAPHSLTVRPIIIPDTSIISLKIDGRDATYNITLDSKTETFDSHYEIQIKKSQRKLKIIKLEGNSYFKTLRNKLMWGIDIRN
jgi:NAD+ kinase